MILDLRQTDVGVSCEDFTLIYVTGPNFKDLPTLIQEKMNQHLGACEYHNTEVFHQSMLSVFVTDELEKEASKIIRKYLESE